MQNKQIEWEWIEWLQGPRRDAKREMSIRVCAQRHCWIVKHVWSLVCLDVFYKRIGLCVSWLSKPWQLLRWDKRVRSRLLQTLDLGWQCQMMMNDLSMSLVSWLYLTFDFLSKNRLKPSLLSFLRRSQENCYMNKPQTQTYTFDTSWNSTSNNFEKC